MSLETIYFVLEAVQLNKMMIVDVLKTVGADHQHHHPRLTFKFSNALPALRTNNQHFHPQDGSAEP
jgi:hypothetical protein